MRTLEDAYAVFYDPYATPSDMQAAQSFIEANESLAPVRGLIAPEEGYTYGDIVPIRTNQATGQRELTVPMFAREGAQSLLNIAEGSQTGVVNPEDVMNVMPMGGAASLLDEGIEGGFAAGMFIARNNPAADKKAFDEAEKLWNKGESPREIYRQTGIYYGRDMQPRQEISDAGQMDKKYLQAVLDVIEQKGQYVVDGDIKSLDMQHLFPDENYRKMFFGNTPERIEMGSTNDRLTSIGTMSKTMGADDTGLGGSYNSGFDRIMINPVTEDLEGNIIMRPIDDVESIIFHELQHGVQAKGLLEGGSNLDDGFNNYRRFVAKVIESGDYESAKQIMANADEARKRLKDSKSMTKEEYNRTYKDAFPKNSYELQQIIDAGNLVQSRYDQLMDRSDRNRSPRYEAYRANLGEIEARATEARKDMPMDVRLGRYPEKDYTSLDKVWFSEPEGGFTGTGLLNIVRD